jgi:hypothetical protein
VERRRLPSRLNDPIRDGSHSVIRPLVLVSPSRMEATMQFSTKQLIERLSLALGAGAVGITILVTAAALSHSDPARQEVAIVAGTSGR